MLERVCEAKTCHGHDHHHVKVSLQFSRGVAVPGNALPVACQPSAAGQRPTREASRVAGSTSHRRRATRGATAAAGIATSGV